MCMKLMVNILAAYSASVLSTATRAWDRYEDFVSRLPGPSVKLLPAGPAVVAVFLSAVEIGEARSAAQGGEKRLRTRI